MMKACHPYFENVKKREKMSKKSWLKSIFTNKRQSEQNHQEISLIRRFTTHLFNLLDEDSDYNYILQKKEEFEHLDLAKKKELLPEIYLLFEEHLSEKNKTHPISSNQLRKEISVNYPELLKLDNFAIIFEELKKQEIILCINFLNHIIEKSLSLKPQITNIKIEQVQQYLNTPSLTFGSDIMDERQRLFSYSITLHNTFKEELGENTIAHIYRETYQEYFKSYYRLNSFTAILNVIPEEILDKELINFPTKQQMIRMLQRQLYSLEEVNDRLTQEIIEKRRVEEKLKDSEHIKSRILETAKDGIILLDQSGIILDWNKQAEQILKVTKEETLGRSIYSLVPSKLREAVRVSVKDYIEGGQGRLINKRVETAITRKDESIIYVEFTIIAIQTKNEPLFNTFFRDITNKKTIDNEIREAKVSAERLAKAKSIFLSNMSHEIRTPLNVILGLAGILQKSGFSDPKMDKKNLDGIRFSAENLLALINDILDFSKIEAGKLSLHKTDFNIHELLENIARGFKIKAEEKGLVFKIFIDQNLPKFIIGDQFRLNQILTNLISNAIKFTKSGYVEVALRIITETPENLLLQFSVTDTGIGIAKDKLDSIFQSFYQIHQKEGKIKIEGTGLGLTITKELIKLHDGRLNADSTLGKGSCFQFSIYYSKSSIIYTESPSISIEHSEKEEYNISGMKILIVEDNEMNQFFIKQLLSSWNIEYDIADNGKIALEKILIQSFDLILMDMHMPVMDGSETAIAIRKSDDKKINSIPIVACSADVFPESQKKAIDSGMNFYITKPVTEKALQEILFGLKPDLKKEKNYKLKENHQKNTSTNAFSKKSYQICNFAPLEKTFDQDGEIIKSILEIFMKETPMDYQSLKNAIEKQNLKEIKSLSHKIKSSFKTIGLYEQASILQKIENYTKEPEFNIVIKDLSNELENYYEDILLEVIDKTKELEERIKN